MEARLHRRSGTKARLKTVTARSTVGLVCEIKAAKKRFGLSEDAPVLSCYEAGRDGFWLHRFLLAHGGQNQVVDSASIEVNRRQRRAKSDGLDAVKPVEMLIRLHNGERKVWKLVRVPAVAESELSQWYQKSSLKATRGSARWGSWRWRGSCSWRCGNTWKEVRSRRERCWSGGRISVATKG